MQNFSISNIINVYFINYNFSMTKTQGALDKAKQSWKKIVEGWKELWIWTAQIVWWTVWALSYTLLSSWEKLASKISESREDDEWISTEEKKSRKKFTAKYNGKAKKHIVKAWDFGKTAVRWTWKAIKWWVKTVWYALKWGYHLVDAWDKAIWDYFEKKQKEKWKKAWKISSFFRDNILKLLIATSAVWYWWYETSHLLNDKQEHKIEVVKENGTKINSEEKSESAEDLILDFEERPYFQNPEFFAKNFTPKKDEKYKDRGIILIRDAWMTFYVVQGGETKKEAIRKKLSSIPEFSYLKDSTYVDKIMGFNVPDASLKKWLYIPIPVKAENRKINIDEFKKYCKVALLEMKHDSVYWKKTQELIKELWVETVINVMTAYARCETSMDHKTFSDPIWTTELHRREPWSEKTPLNAFSFSYYHILMEKNADGKTPWPWLKARQNLWLTEWQCYHPMNAWKLFLGYCFEKVKSDPTYFFKIKNLEEARIKWGKYNWDPSYWNKLWDNIQHIK